MVMVDMLGLRITAESSVVKTIMKISSSFSGVSLSVILILPQAMVELEGWNSNRNESEAKSLFTAGGIISAVSNIQFHYSDQGMENM